MVIFPSKIPVSHLLAAWLHLSHPSAPRNLFALILNLSKRLSSFSAAHNLSHFSLAIMTDLLGSLVLPNNSSQDSFHSLAEHPSPTSPTDPSANYDSATPQPSSSQSQPSALQAAGLPIYGVDAYLSAPEHAALLHRAPDRKNAPMRQPNQELGPAQPVSLGSKSSHHTTALNLLCQQKGLTFDFQIDGDASNADFGGSLKIGDLTIASDERWHSKKEAREALSGLALESVKGMDAKRKAPGTPGEKDKNWIGMLVGTCLARSEAQAETVLRSDYLTIRTRVSPTRQPKPRTSLPRLLSRIVLQLYMYPLLSPRPTLRFLNRTVPVQEGRPRERCTTRRRTPHRNRRARSQRQPESAEKGQGWRVRPRQRQRARGQEGVDVHAESERRVQPPRSAVPAVRPRSGLGPGAQYLQRPRVVSQRARLAEGDWRGAQRLWEEECKGGNRKGGVGGVAEIGGEEGRQHQ